MTVPLFVELCAGTAALSLRLHARGARPPVSRMGAKTGYADAILRVLGLAPGTRAAHYLWCEPDPGVRLLLEAYRDADLARAAAAVIRSWADEEPRALWERLRAEGPPVLPATGPEVARWVVTGEWAFRRGEPESGYAHSRACAADRPGMSVSCLGGSLALMPSLPATIAPDARTVDPREVARWAVVGAWSFRAGEPESGFNRSEAEGHPDSRKYPRDCARLSVDHAALPTLPATIHPDARTVDPREVARWVVTGQWAYRPGQPESGFAACRAYERIGPDGYPRMDFDIPTVTARFDAAPTLPATIHPDALDVHPPALPPGTVCYMDPPYVGTTGYAADLPRSEVVTLARRWQAAGARVCISEAEPIPELVADGWHAVRIDGERVGQARTFSRQKSEWLTLSDPPAWRPSVQAGLFW